MIIIIGGSGRLKNEIDKANQAASVNNWTQAQIDFMAAKFATLCDQIDSQCSNPQPPA